MKIKFPARTGGSACSDQGRSRLRCPEAHRRRRHLPQPDLLAWFSEYSASHPGVQINYQSVGSGAGIRQVSQDCGLWRLDGPMTDQQLKLSRR
jgi:hypothetical protein